jgi:uncharacterized protein YegL
VVSVITFGGEAAIHMAPTAAAQVAWKDLQADGGTPMGEALAIAKKLIKDKEALPSRAYRPAVVLVSDGQPTDEWQGPLNAFIKEGRSAKCDRMSMGIGSDVDESVLSAFIAGTPHPLYRAANAGQLHEFFPPRDNVGRHEGIFQNPERDSRRDQLNRCGRSLCGRKTQFAISTTIRIGKRGGLLVRK